MTPSDWFSVVTGLIGIVGVVVGVALSHWLGRRQLREIEERSRAHELRVVIARVQGHTNLLSHRVRLGPEMARQKLGWAAKILDPNDLVPHVWRLFVDEARVDLADLGARIDLAGYLSRDALKHYETTFGIFEDAGTRKSEPSYIIGWSAKYVAALDALAAEVDRRFRFDTRVRRGRHVPREKGEH